MKRFKDFLIEKKQPTYSNLYRRLVDVLNDYSVLAYNTSTSHFVTSFDNDQKILFNWNVEDFGDSLSIIVKVNRTLSVGEINLSSWNVENVSRILLDTSLFVDPNKIDLLKEKLDYQNKTVTDMFGGSFSNWIDYSSDAFSKPFKKYLMYIVASEVVNGYNQGLDDNCKIASVQETPEGYNVYIKPLGASSIGSIVVIQMVNNILSLDVSYNNSEAFLMKLNDDNFNSFREKLLRGIGNLVKTNSPSDLIRYLSWFGYSQEEKKKRQNEFGLI